MVNTRPPTSKSSRPFNNPLVSVPKPPITIGIIATFMFHSFFFYSLARSRYLSFFSHFFSFILWSAGTAKLTILQVLFFCCCCWLLLSLVFWPRLGDPCVYQSPIGVCVCHFVGQMLVCAYTIFFCMVKFEFLAHLPVDYLAHPVVSSLILFWSYYVIDGFVSVTTSRLLYSRFDMIGSSGQCFVLLFGEILFLS